MRALSLVIVLCGIAVSSTACPKPPIVTTHAATNHAWSSVVFAQNAGDCGGCNAACAGDVDRCRVSRNDTSAECALARGCECQCRMNAGGCGFAKEYLARCVQQSAAEAWTEMLTLPSPCGPDQRACATLSGVPLCVPQGERCPR